MTPHNSPSLIHHKHSYTHTQYISKQLKILNAESPFKHANEWHEWTCFSDSTEWVSRHNREIRHIYRLSIYLNKILHWKEMNSKTDSVFLCVYSQTQFPWFFHLQQYCAYWEDAITCGLMKMLKSVTFAWISSFVAVNNQSSEVCRQSQQISQRLILTNIPSLPWSCSLCMSGPSFLSRLVRVPCGGTTVSSQA